MMEAREAGPAVDVRKGLIEDYRHAVRIRGLILLLTLIALSASLVLDLGTGPGRYPLREVVSTLFQREAAPIQLSVVVWDLRFPIALMAVITGIMLALAGGQMQTILNNPLADPFTLGISSAASFGAALGIVLGRGVPFVPVQYLVTVNAFIFSFGTSLFLYMFTRLRGVTVETMVLTGIAMLFTFGALLSLLQYGATENDLAELTFWMMGSLGKATWGKIYLCTALLVVICPYFASKISPMTALRMGDERARTMGIHVERLRLQMLFFISVLASTSVAFIGTVGFVGLVGPHIARMVLGEDQRYFLPMAGLVGGLLMSLTSILSKTIVPGVIFPIGIITSLVGIPFFLSLILANRKKSW